MVQAGPGRIALALGAAAALGGLAVSGCSAVAENGRAAALAARPTPRYSAPPEILDGTSLRSLLLPAAAMPAGLRPAAAGARDSGGAVAGDTSTPPAPGTVCGLLTGTSWLLAAGVTGAAFAQDDYLSPSRTAEAGQEIDAFQGTDAQRVMSRLWAVFQHCTTFRAWYRGRAGTVTTHSSRLTTAGEPAVRLVMTSPLYRGGETLAAIRAGNNIISCFYSSPGRDRGAAALTLARRLAARVRHAMR